MTQRSKTFFFRIIWQSPAINLVILKVLTVTANKQAYSVACNKMRTGFTQIGGLLEAGISNYPYPLSSIVVLMANHELNICNYFNKAKLLALYPSYFTPEIAMPDDLHLPDGSGR